MYRVLICFQWQPEISSWPHQRKIIVFSKHGLEEEDVKAEAIDPQRGHSLTLSPEASTEHSQCPPPPRASHRNCAVFLFSYLMCFIHSMCISLITL